MSLNVHEARHDWHAMFGTGASVQSTPPPPRYFTTATFTRLVASVATLLSPLSPPDITVCGEQTHTRVFYLG